MCTYSDVKDGPEHSEDPKKKKRTGDDKLSLDDTSEGFDSGLSARNKG
jgi:hypothetical protein